MEIIKSFLNFSSQTFGNLGSTDDGLTIQVRTVPVIGKTSSLSQATILTQSQSSKVFASHDEKRKILPYTLETLQNLDKQTVSSHQRADHPKSNPQINSFISGRTFIEGSNNSNRASIKSQPVQSTKRIQVTKKSRYWELLEQCIRKGQKFTDSQFPPTDASMGSPNYLIQQDKYGGWKRISQILENPVFVNKFDSRDVIQGKIQDCYFLSSIASLAEDYPNIFQKVFVSQKYSEHGIYMAKFYVQGIIVQVVVDDYVPIYKTNNKKPLFAKPSKQNQIWAMILQKCWAKLCKSFQRIDRGQPEEAFYAFVGCPYGIKIAGQLPKEQQEQEFKKLFKFQSKGSIFSCYTYNERMVNQSFKSQGLVSNHAYSVLQLIIEPICMAKLRNPWGSNKGLNDENKYNYKWQKKLPEIYGEQHAKRLLKELNQKYHIDLNTPQEDGVFYMHYDEFMKKFQSVTVCDYAKDLNLLSHRTTFTKNVSKVFYFDLSKPSQVVVSLSQMFKKIDQTAQVTKFVQNYEITRLILAKQIHQNKHKRNNNGSFESISEQSSQVFNILSSNSNISLSNRLKEQQKKEQYSQNQNFYYEFKAARSNNMQTPFNFLSFTEEYLTPGRYIVYAVSDVKINSKKQYTKDFTITVQSSDINFPKEMNKCDLYPSEKKSFLGNLFSKNQQDFIEIKFLTEVLLNKALKQNDLKRRLDGYQAQTQPKSTQSLQMFDKTQIPADPSMSWYIFKPPQQTFYQKMGGFGYFVCHLEKSHKGHEIFEFKLRQYNRRMIQLMYEEQLVDKDNAKQGLIKIKVKAGETKLVIMKLIPPSNEAINQVAIKFPDADIVSLPPMPRRVGIVSQKLIPNRLSTQSLSV